jgi:hypothetical protein
MLAKKSQKHFFQIRSGGGILIQSSGARYVARKSVTSEPICDAPLDVRVHEKKGKRGPQTDLCDTKAPTRRQGRCANFLNLFDL